NRRGIRIKRRVWRQPSVNPAIHCKLAAGLESQGGAGWIDVTPALSPSVCRCKSRQERRCPYNSRSRRSKAASFQKKLTSVDHHITRPSMKPAPPEADELLMNQVSNLLSSRSSKIR